MNKTVVALYDDFDTAREAVEELVEAGFQRDAISLVANDVRGEYGQQITGETAASEDVSAGEGAGFGAVVGALVGLGAMLIPGVGPVIAAGPLVAALVGGGVGAVAGAATGGIVAGLVTMGVPEEEAGYYAEGIRRGGALVTLTTSEDRATRAQEIMNLYYPIDINERVADYREGGWTGYHPDLEPYTDEQIMRERERYRAAAGGERVHAESRPMMKDDLNPYQEGTLESDERPMVAKETRVAQEGMSDRDMARQSSAQVESAREAVPAGGHPAHSFEASDAYFREHYNVNFSQRGQPYSFYMPAYRYGYTLANHERYSRYNDWTELETDARRHWEDRNPGTWERFKDAVREGWQRVKNQFD